MMKPLPYLMVLVAVLFSGCATSFNLSPVTEQNDNERIVYLDGMEAVISHGGKSTITIFGEKAENSEINLYISYQNDSEDMINVDPGLIQLIGTDNESSIPLKVYSANEYLKKLKRKQSLQTFSNTLQAANETYNAGKTSSTTSGNVGGVPFSSHTKTHDAGKQAEATRENSERMAATTMLNTQILQSTKRELVKKNTLNPGQSVSGKVIAKYRRCSQYTVIVPVENDVHRIIFKPKYE